MCFNSSSSSSSSSSSDVFDERIGADNGSVAIRELSGGSFSFRDTDEDVAIAAIEEQRDTAKTSIDAVTQTTKDALTASTDFISNAFSQVLSVSEKSAERSEANLNATRDFASGIISEEQESSDERLIQIVQFLALAGVGIVAIQSGLFKDLKGVFK